MIFINAERQAKYNEIEKCIEKSLERGLTEKIRKPMYLSLDLLKIEEAIEEQIEFSNTLVENLERQKQNLERQKQNLINSLTEIVEKRQEERAIRINALSVQLTQQGYTQQ